MSTTYPNSLYDQPVATSFAGDADPFVARVAKLSRIWRREPAERRSRPITIRDFPRQTDGFSQISRKITDAPNPFPCGTCAESCGESNRFTGEPAGDLLIGSHSCPPQVLRNPDLVELVQQRGMGRETAYFAGGYCVNRHE